MAVAYEINPPKIPGDGPPSKSELDTLLGIMMQRISAIADLCDGIHVTESVLGTRRISPIETAAAIRRRHPDLRITVTMKVVDKDMDGIHSYVREAAEAGIDGLLVLKGDMLRDNRTDSGLVPSKVVEILNDTRGMANLKLFLSLPSNPDFAKITKKIHARPAGFVTQVISSSRQVERICGELAPRGFEVVPIVLLPSEKNKKSASMLGLDWSGYAHATLEFTKEMHDIAGNVLITSPNDFGLARDALVRLRGMIQPGRAGDTWT